MDVADLIAALSQLGAYPHAADAVEVCQTHISLVFLASEYAYKVKKPVDLGFLDFSTLEKRRHFCEEEVRLNRRLAASVYLGVVPVTRQGAGVRIEGEGEVVDYAVKMKRLPSAATLESLLQRGQVTSDLLQSLARKIAAFHAEAEAGDHIASFGQYSVIAGNALENFEQSRAHIGKTVSTAVHERLRVLTEEALAALRPLVERRAREGMPRDTHGDLRLDHVYVFPDKSPPDDLVVIDCIEFNERFRYADPVADMAFLTMDLAFHGRRDLATAFAAAYFDAAQDHEGGTLLSFYVAYRAAVRGKVEGFALGETEIPVLGRAAALTTARAHWLLSLAALEEPGRRPCLLLIGGLPGTGKSTLARGLAARGDFSIVRSDEVRKELAAGLVEAQAGISTGLYSPEWTERTYAECRRRAETLLFEGKRVIVDANFREEKQRRAFLDAAWGVPVLFLICEADSEVVRRRLEARQDDASDADWTVHQQLAPTWEEPSEVMRAFAHTIVCGGTPEETLALALAVLAVQGVA